MKIFCASFDLNESGIVVLQGEYDNYIRNVMRFKKGQELVLFNTDDKKRYIAQVDFFNREGVGVKIISEATMRLASDIEIFLAFSLLKSGHVESIIKGATEVGVKGFMPFISERTVVKDNGNKKQRWEKIIKSAVEQSGATDIPFISETQKLTDILNDVALYDIVLSGDAALESQPIDCLDLSNKQRVLLIVGPEGGFAKEEKELLHKQGEVFSFGKNVLRAETAGVVLPALLLNEMQRQRKK